MIHIDKDENVVSVNLHGNRLIIEKENKERYNLDVYRTKVVPDAYMIYFYDNQGSTIVIHNNWNVPNWKEHVFPKLDLAIKQWELNLLNSTPIEKINNNQKLEVNTINVIPLLQELLK
jgi:hypothetical protein